MIENFSVKNKKTHRANEKMEPLLRVEAWIRDQRGKIRLPTWLQVGASMWSPWGWKGREEKRRMQEEYERRKRQLQELCRSVKAESVSDLQDVLCSLVLSECVYKKPAAEIVKVVNKFKADFGGQIVCLERVQPSLDHVSHRYLLAEAGDTLFASFIGTKQYKDIVTDANILQGAIFHEDSVEDDVSNEISESDQDYARSKSEESFGKLPRSKTRDVKKNSKPAVHRGFLARAKGIPALELYRLAQKKNRKLVLCGHSLGGAVAALATLSILRVIASSCSSKENGKVEVKCITFSQPPVGNAALRDYVHKKGWQQYFKTYCIPEDLVPRILSPAYFHHYNAQQLHMSVDGGAGTSMVKQGEKRSAVEKSKDNGGEQLVLGLGPVQTSFWRLSKLVPIESVRKKLDIFKGRSKEPGGISSVLYSSSTPTVDEIEATPPSLEIQEGSEGISLTPISDMNRGSQNGTNRSLIDEKNGIKGPNKGWHRVPYLPQYVPFGQLFLLGNTSVELLSEAEYSKLTSVRSVIAELKERLQSHSMNSYRSRFQKIYDLCMCVSTSSFLGIDQMSQFPHLQQWLGLAAAGVVELGHIVEPPIIQAATSIVPLGWNGAPGDKNADPLKVDISGHGLHLCTLVQARVNGNWCSTALESLPSIPPYSSNHESQNDMQKMRVLIGPPLKSPPKYPVPDDYLISALPPSVTDSVNICPKYNMGFSFQGDTSHPEGLNDFIIYCTNDFITVSKEVFVRTRRVQLVGLEGSGKTTLFNAISGLGKPAMVNLENVLAQANTQERIVGGLCYSDSPGINLQELHLEATRFKDELRMGLRCLGRKTDLVVLVHNLSHIIPHYHQSNTSQPKPQSQPVLSLFMNEVKALRIPWVLAITNKFSVSAHQQKSAVKSVMEAYEACPSMTEVINSHPYVMPSEAGSSQLGVASDDGNNNSRMAPQRLILAPFNLVRIPFQRKDIVLSVDGVNSLCQLIHRVLRSNEEKSFQELTEEVLEREMERERARITDTRRHPDEKENSITAAAVGASLGAGLGLVLAVVMGAASALRKP
ncbi:hypothetical protein QJS10_CPB04g01414 [Acorus calamus]|uniref:Fungal lipase-type domain-containing protein n=1 Tax=Acorus calamus TaxID=4465 RepID=A0AAV9F336_ACOCL|nr:hypothetical protein QJS10_CPB04g01414 [Acorus calamus]